jgi:hypothetical protein
MQAIQFYIESKKKAETISYYNNKYNKKTTQNTLKYKIGQNVAVAYMDVWYPGQIVFVAENVLTVKFLHPAKCNIFKWPEKEDTSIIDKMFVFHFGFDILPKDSFGRTWYIQVPFVST